MKKLLSLITVICCMSLILCFPVNADAANEVLFEVDAVGDTITVNIATGFNCGAVQGILTYDGSEIAYSSSSFASALSSKNSEANSFANSSGATKVGLVCASSGGVNGDLATITYTADAGVPAEFDFGSLKAFAADGTQISSVEAVMVMYGDANGDHLLNIIDLVRIKKGLAGQSLSTPNVARNCDVDKNGAQNAADVTALINKLLR